MNTPASILLSDILTVASLFHALNLSVIRTHVLGNCIHF